MNIYKTCPKCNGQHDKSSRFCSRSCANSRQWTDKDKLKKSTSAKNSLKVINSLKTLHTNNTLPRKTKQCFICGKEVQVISTFSRSNIICDNEECRHKQYQMAGLASAAARKLRSKDEISLFNYCSKHFNVENNIVICNGWDADIILRDEKIAIMWNGPWHYKDMKMTNHSLNQVVNRDILKIIEFEKIGWQVYIYEDRYWTPEAALIDILLNVGRR